MSVVNGTINGIITIDGVPVSVTLTISNRSTVKSLSPNPTNLQTIEGKSIDVLFDALDGGMVKVLNYPINSSDPAKVQVAPIVDTLGRQVGIKLTGGSVAGQVTITID